jgi:quercetin dioxygenase-like cupin family protein
MTAEHLSEHARVVPPGEGAHFEFLNHLATVKVRAGEGGSLSVVEFLGPRGFGPPEHRHNDEDELFVVLDGEVAFRAGDLETVGGPGSLAYLPRALPHTFQILSEIARFVTVTGSTSGVPRFDSMVTALGVPTDEPSIPEESYIDPVRVAEVCAAHGVDIVGPPPPALAPDIQS